MDLHMPVCKSPFHLTYSVSCLTVPFLVDGEGAARYIKSTNSKNTATPIIAVSAYSPNDVEANSVFAASLSKPLQKADLLAVMRTLGFRTSTIQGAGTTKVSAPTAVVPLLPHSSLYNTIS